MLDGLAAGKDGTHDDPTNPNRKNPARFNRLNEEYPAEGKLHLVTDNDGTHSPPRLQY